MPRSFAADGRAIFMIDESRTIISCATAMIPRISQRRGSGVSVVDGASATDVRAGSDIEHSDEEKGAASPGERGTAGGPRGGPDETGAGLSTPVPPGPVNEFSAGSAAILSAVPQKVAVG